MLRRFCGRRVAARRQPKNVKLCKAILLMAVSPHGLRKREKIGKRSKAGLVRHTNDRFME